MSDDPRRRTPRTDAVLADERLAAAVHRLGRSSVKDAVVAALDSCRTGRTRPEEVVDTVLATLPASASSLRAVVNATGVIVHTNLGRAPLSAAAADAVAVAAGHTDVELDLATGRRGRRGTGALAALAAQVPDAGGVHVVNNGAAALALAVCGLAQGREVVIARGELVEIGDGFRIPELLESVGARLREVGATNRVRLADYAEAVGPETGCVLKVHPSNFRVEGFTSSVAVAELATLCSSSGSSSSPSLVVDIGSGLLRPHPRLPDEPDAATALRAGADLVTASGDKLLGGPQCGLVLGESRLVERLRQHPLARALRVDKLTLAALEATLTGPTAPVPAALERPVAELRARADRLADALPGLAEAVDSAARVGGGGAPGVTLPSAAVSLPASLAAPLRHGDLPVLGRVTDGRLLLDLVAVPPEQDAALLTAVRRAAAAAAAATGPVAVHVFATAGHVDHGKSTLVRALTGSDPDRLEEERRRGLSIRLGYCWTTLAGAGQVAFVDVPGHERFLATALSGIGPVSATMFVVAADDDWMPQAAEHLAALDGLGVAHACWW